MSAQSAVTVRDRSLDTTRYRNRLIRNSQPLRLARAICVQINRSAAVGSREMDLHLGQELLLMQLFDRDGQTQSELLDSVGLDHSTVSKSLRRMQDAGLLIREPAAHDRRVTVVHLTDKGRAMRERIAALWQTLEEASTRNLSERQMKSFLRTARAMTETINNRTLPQHEPP